jgi:hypothetical protein
LAANREGRNDVVTVLLLYLGLGLASTLLWARTANLSALPQWHADIVAGSAPAPNQYRALTPWLAEIGRILTGDLLSGYLVVRAVCTTLALFCFDRYLRVWFSRSASIAGAIFLAAIIPYTYWHVLQESDPLNLLIIVNAFWAIAAGRDSWLIALVAVGTLNRETVLMIPAVYFVTRWRHVPAARLTAWTAAIAGTWLLVYSLLRSVYGYRPYYTGVVKLADNLSSILPTTHVLLMYGAIWVLAVVGRRTAPEMLTRALWLIPPFIALHYVVAVADEVRIFLPLAPILIPLAWCRLFPESRIQSA